GQPTRFLTPITRLRAQYPAIRLSFHAGESEHADTNIRDTLLLGAERIGHGINLLKDPSTYLLMRHNRYLIETNLISNLKLEYIDDLSAHPFPQLLRTGVPTALSTDDRGMWDATLTDEYYLALTQFNLSWSELVTLSQNSIKYSFLQDEKKEQLLTELNRDLTQFLALIAESANQIPSANSKVQPLNSNVERYSDFICEFAASVCANEGNNKEITRK
ncbi:MAG TPA: adenosine deaminase, partial [Alteromonas macleodii]|nr:adenosine deaminase [Alteromonas macleodii]